jgi:hypothetical protein
MIVFRVRRPRALHWSLGVLSWFRSGSAWR